jgi:hypothetical protein
MKPFRRSIRKPILNQFSETYLFIILLSFAASVATTRMFLVITGYPQIGNGGLHIAHVLWGGLLLFIATLLLLIYANRWIFPISAMLSGIGVGLFIDEVGKFITIDNNYFYPSAAPIIYSVFLLTVLVFLIVRKPRKQDTRTNLYYILEDLREVLDHDLSDIERERIQSRLENILSYNPDEDLGGLTRDLLKFIRRKRIYLAPHRLTLIERINLQWATFENRWLNRTRFRRLLFLGLGIWGIFLLTAPTAILVISNTPAQLEDLLTLLSRNELMRNPSGLNWFEARVMLESLIGLFLCVSALIWLFNQERIAVMTCIVTLLFSLSVANLLVFYFDQFSAIITSAIQFILLIGILRYRQLFLNPINPNLK